jgi:hypothetical protein
MRVLVVSTFALAVMLLPASGFAQAPPAQQPPTAQPPATGQPPTGQPPTGQPPTGQPPAGQAPGAQPATPGPPKLSFPTPAGILLVQVKPDQAAAFEEMIGKLRAGLAKSDKPELKQQANSWKVYRANEPMAGNTLFVVVIDPAMPNTEYQFLQVLNNTLTPEEQRSPETQEMYKRYAAAIANMNRLNVTPVGGGQ